MVVWAVVLSIVGLALVLAEVFFPSLGAFGIAAAACVMIADTLAFGAHPAIGWVFVVAQVILVPIVVVWGFKVLPKTGFGSRMVLSGPDTAPGRGAPDLDYLVGKTGAATTALRPAGTARIDDQRVSVVSQTGMVDVGTQVVVVSVEGTEVKVRPVPAADGEPASS